MENCHCSTLSLLSPSPTPEAFNVVSFCVYLHDILYTTSIFIFVFSLRGITHPFLSVFAVFLQGEKKESKCLGFGARLPGFESKLTVLSWES